MARAIRPATVRDVADIRQAHELLKQARDLLARAGAAKAATATRSAVASAGGALRHADHREARTSASLTAYSPPPEAPFSSSEES